MIRKNLVQCTIITDNFFKISRKRKVSNWYKYFFKINENKVSQEPFSIRKMKLVHISMEIYFFIKLENPKQEIEEWILKNIKKQAYIAIFKQKKSPG